MCGLIVCCFGLAIICILLPLSSFLLGAIFGISLTDLFWSLLAFSWQIILMLRYVFYIWALGYFQKFIDEYYTNLARVILESRLKVRYSNESSYANKNNFTVFLNIFIVLCIVGSLYSIMYLLEGWINFFIKLPYFMYISYIFGLCACFPIDSNLSQVQYESLIRDYYGFKAKLQSKINFNNFLFFMIFCLLDFFLVKDSLFYEFYQLDWKNQFSFLSLFTEIV